MMIRPDRRRFRGDWHEANLEPRSLLATGIGGAAPAVLRDMGSVSRGVALVGAAATAAIDPGGAVTFRFRIEAAGDYTLRVRHDGDGLSLVALTPGGLVGLDPGPGGPTRVVPLQLDVATYEVTASAVGGRPVFVDWDLLLNSGVGQAPAAALGPVVAAPPTPASPAPPVVAPTPVATPLGWGDVAPIPSTPPAQPLPYPATGLVMGRPIRGPVAPPDGTSPLVTDLAGVAANRPSTVEVAMTGALRVLSPADRQDGLTPTAPSDRDPEPGPVDGPDVAAGGLDPTTFALTFAGSPWCRSDLVGPGLCIAAVLATRARFRRLRAAPATPREYVRLLVEQVG